MWSVKISLIFLRRFAEDGVNFSLNTDDMLVCRTDMKAEFDVAFNKMGFTAALLTKAVSTRLSGFLNADFHSGK